MSRSNTLLLAVTSPLTWGFHRGLIGYLRRNGIEPILLSSPGPQLKITAEREGVGSIGVPMEREISALRDLASLWRLYRTIVGVRPAIVHASTPKAGLLVSAAAWLARVPYRLHTIHGLRLETTRGWKRRMLWLAEWISCACCHRVLCISPSLHRRAVALKLVSASKSAVVAGGGFGVDLQHFKPSRRSAPGVKALRHELGIHETALVIGYVGRLVKDKGIAELVESFDKLRVRFPELRLLIVGEFESGDPIDPEVRRYIESSPEIIQTGFVTDTAPYFLLMDILALPTYREGFGQVSIEAQSSGVPVVTTTATGAVDSVIDQETGFLVNPGDADALAAGLEKLLADPELRGRMGRAGREWMERDFRPEVIWNAQLNIYREVLATRMSHRADVKEGFKRVFDLFASVVLLIVLSPLLALIALSIWATLGRPVLFVQGRPGLGGKLFPCVKFRTMNDARDGSGNLLPDSERLTALGRFLRSTSLDELPELFNVIRGEMSLVGPRPLMAQYLARYTPEQMRRHDAKPGITGWAQVHGRNTLSWEEKFKHDLWYIAHQSFWLDLRILARTVLQVLRRKGISQAGHATMPEFVGAPGKCEQGNL